MELSSRLQKVCALLPSCVAAYLTEDTREIHFRKGRPILLSTPTGEIRTNLICDQLFLEKLIDDLTRCSIYTYTDNITDGFLTLEGGHRVGLCGTGVYHHGKLSDVRDISSVNFRIAREVKGCANTLFRRFQSKPFFPGILIVSLPGCGKTTLLRDLIRLISDTATGSNISVIDERNELSGTFRGEAQNDLGKRTDILNGYQKADGILRAVRSLSPTLIGVDEIGSSQDEDALLTAHYSGVKVIATIHGTIEEDFQKKIPRLIKAGVFDYYVYLSNQQIQSVVSAKEERKL